MVIALAELLGMGRPGAGLAAAAAAAEIERTIGSEVEVEVAVTQPEEMAFEQERNQPGTLVLHMGRWWLST